MSIRKTGMSSHQATQGQTNTWLTPPSILNALGDFDLDPCAPVNRPWDIAKHHYTVAENGLKQDWFGRVFLNPPYDRYTIEQWMARMGEHGNGISLLFARTETAVFQKLIFEQAHSMLFIKGRLNFYTVKGELGEFNGGAPSVLIAYGRKNVEALGDCGIEGKHVLINYTPVIVIGLNRSWKTVVSITLNRLDGEAEVQEIYKMVERIAPEKVRGNTNYKAKIRQILQYHFTQIKRGKYAA